MAKTVTPFLLKEKKSDIKDHPRLHSDFIKIFPTFWRTNLGYFPTMSHTLKQSQHFLRRWKVRKKLWWSLVGPYLWSFHLKFCVKTFLTFANFFDDFLQFSTFSDNFRHFLSISAKLRRPKSREKSLVEVWGTYFSVLNWKNGLKVRHFIKNKNLNIENIS